MHAPFNRTSSWGLATWLLLIPSLGSGQDDSTASDAARTPDVVYVATPHDVVARMLELARPTPGDVLYDLGCGDGRIVVTAARQYGCRGLGIDINPLRVQESQQNAAKYGVESLVSIGQQDIFDLDLRPATIVTLYLLPRLNERLIPQLEKLAPGSRVLSHDYSMKSVPPDKMIEMTSREDGASHHIYVWTTPLKKDRDE
jgi:SAM-dependent methyltransferase